MPHRSSPHALGPARTEPPEPPSETLLDRYLTGECSSSEADSVRRWLAADPVNAVALDGLRKIREVMAPPMQAWDASAAWRTLRQEVVGEKSMLPMQPNRVLPLVLRQEISRRWPVSRLIPVGITTVCIAGLIGIAGKYVMSRVALDSNKTLAPTYAVYTTGNHQVTRLSLADGSHVTLAPNSRLVMPRDGATPRTVNARTVALTGEAYFEVAPAHNAPFVVHTGTVTIRVLGTSFDVTRYLTDREARVAVTSGKVVVMGHQAVVLAAGDVGRVSDSTATAKTVDDVATYAEWTQGRLAFHETPVPDVLSAIGHWYGIDFQLADTTLASGAVTAALHGETTAEVLTLLRTLLDATMTFNTHDGRQVVILHARHRAQGEPVKTRPATQGMFFNHGVEVGR